MRFKELTQLYWQGGGRPVHLPVVAPAGYRTSKNVRKYYRQPAYLPTTDLRPNARVLLQAYFDRWASEVNHLDEKEFLGVSASPASSILTCEVLPTKLAIPPLLRSNVWAIVPLVMSGSKSAFTNNVPRRVCIFVSFPASNALILVLTCAVRR